MTVHIRETYLPTCKMLFFTAIVSAMLLPAAGYADAPVLVTPENERRFQQEAGTGPQTDKNVTDDDTKARKTIYRRTSREDRVDKSK